MLNRIISYFSVFFFIFLFIDVSLKDNYFFCNDYISQVTYNFSNPKTGAMIGMMELHEYLMFFLFIILIYTTYFLYLAFKTAYYYNKSEFVSSDYSDRLLLKESIKNYIDNKLNLSYYHYPLLEFIWTIVPAVVLVIIAYPSFILLYTLDLCIDPVYTVIITGNQWFWTYEYSDFDVHSYLRDIFESRSVKYGIYSAWLNAEQATGVFETELFEKAGFFKKMLKIHLDKFFATTDLEHKIKFNSTMLPENMLPLGYPRLLSTDQVLVLPSKTPVRLLITSNDVIHSWAVPSFGIKMDAVPGRLNQVYFYTEFDGTSWGQCSELCGVDHGFMPIEVRVIRVKEFLFFVDLKIKQMIKSHVADMQMFLYTIVKNYLTIENIDKVGKDLLMEVFNEDPIIFDYLNRLNYDK